MSYGLVLCRTSNSSILARVRSENLCSCSFDTRKCHFFGTRTRSILGMDVRKCSANISEHLNIQFFTKNYSILPKNGPKTVLLCENFFSVLQRDKRSCGSDPCGHGLSEQSVQNIRI